MKAPLVPAWLPGRLARADFHVECMETSGRLWHEFYGRALEEFLDFVAEQIGIEVWYTSLPKAGERSSLLLPAYHLMRNSTDYDVPEDFIPRFVTRGHHHVIKVVACYKMNAWLALGKLRPDWLIRDLADGR